MKIVKNLGMYFDRFLTFESHIDMLHRKVTGTLIYLYRVKDLFEPKTRIIVVQSLSLSLINYCFVVWGSTNNFHLSRVQKLMNFAARVAIGTVRKYEHISPFLDELGWLRVKNKYKYDVCVLVFKVLRNLLPNCLYNFENVNHVTQRSTRQADKLLVRRARTDIGSREMDIRGPSLWNTLPCEIRNAGSLPAFKNNLKRHLLEEYQ